MRHPLHPVQQPKPEPYDEKALIKLVMDGLMAKHMARIDEDRAFRKAAEAAAVARAARDVRRRLKPAQKVRAIASIRRLAATGLSQRQIAEELAMSKGTVAGICYRMRLETSVVPSEEHVGETHFDPQNRA